MCKHDMLVEQVVQSAEGQPLDGLDCETSVNDYYAFESSVEFYWQGFHHLLEAQERTVTLAESVEEDDVESALHCGQLQLECSDEVQVEVFCQITTRLDK